LSAFVESNQIRPIDDTVNAVLYIITQPHQEISAEIARRFAERKVLFADLSESGVEAILPENWQRLRIADFVDTAAYRCDFLGFLETWPQTPISNGKSFDDLFRLPSGYSLWWTTVAADRTYGKKPERQMRMLWILDRIIRHTSPTEVMIASKDGAIVAALASRCAADGIKISTDSNLAATLRQRQPNQVLWLLWVLQKLVLRPFKLGILAALVRLYNRLPPQSAEDRQKPIVLFGTKDARGIEERDGIPCIPFWESFRSELERRAPHIRQKTAIKPETGGKSRLQIVLWLRNSGRRLQGHFGDPLPMRHRYTGLGSWLAALPSQLSALLRYCRLERTTSFRDSFRFAGMDAFPILVPKLRDAIASIAEWERKVSVSMKRMRRIGNVKATLIRGEFYRALMPAIAAAQRRGITVIGVQHGTVFPMHLNYNVPRGQVYGAPVPDYFAAYGNYSKEVVSKLGSFPAERVWVTGAPRLDYLVLNPRDRWEMRRSLGFPADKQIVLIATQTPPWFLQAVQAVFAAAKERTDCIVCVKAHFGDRRRLKTYRDAAEQLGLTAVMFFEDRFEDLLAACDVLVSASSTTVLEACLLGKPTICVNFSDEPDRYPYVADGASLPARSCEEMRTSLDVILSKRCDQELVERRRAFLGRHAGPTADGRGTSRLVDHVINVVSPTSEVADVSEEDIPVIPTPALASTDHGRSMRREPLADV
jgi:hypothetical protein